MSERVLLVRRAIPDDSTWIVGLSERVQAALTASGSLQEIGPLARRRLRHRMVFPTRFVQHIDDNTISALKAYYSTIIQPAHSVLDLCSSWVSHLPSTLKPSTMIGYGMNKQELGRNGHLTSYFVKDLNEKPSLEEVESESIDVVICNVSVGYLVKPIKVFEEMRRALKVGGTAHMAFSNRCFPTKVIGRWMRMSDEERRRWVGGYFWACGG